jgi:hypothetical protein
MTLTAVSGVSAPRISSDRGGSGGGVAEETDLAASRRLALLSDRLASNRETNSSAAGRRSRHCPSS